MKPCSRLTRTSGRSGRSAPSTPFVRARRGRPPTQTLPIPSTQLPADSSPPRKSGTFSMPKSGTFSVPIDTLVGTRPAGPQTA